MDTRNMQGNFAVNKYLHTVASCWILLIYQTSSFSSGNESGLYSAYAFDNPKVYLYYTCGLKEEL